MTLRLRAPAKLNLYLRVLGKRPDGYHEIETLFERIDLADELTIEPHPDQLLLTCDAPELSCGEDNLILKAARLLQQVGGTHQGARLHLIKRIPIAAGLGGGSSDAAATLLGLNRLWGLGLTPSRLRELGASLGSDVPFFLADAPWAIGRGRGEVCEPLDLPRLQRSSLGANGEPVEPEPLPGGLSLAHVLVVPNIRLSTKDIYEGCSSGAKPKAESRDGSTRPSASLTIPSERSKSRDDPAIAPPPGFASQSEASGVGDMVMPPPMGGRDVAPHGAGPAPSGGGAGVPVPRALPVGLHLTATRPSLMMVKHAFSNGPAATGLARVLWNDLEPEAIRRCPAISRIQHQLRALGCLGTRLSGSGPAVFGLCHDAGHAKRVTEAMRAQAAPSWRVELVQTDSSSRVLSPDVIE